MELKPEDLNRFFDALARRWHHPTTVILVGGAASFVFGGVRPTQDIDFEVRLKDPTASWETFDAAVQAARDETAIHVQYSESVERWSQLAFLDYRKHTRPFKRFGALDVRVLDPLYWSIGKIGRYWDQDIKDLIAVFQRHHTDPVALATLWHEVLRRSPKSTQLASVRRQALHFFETHGPRIWGSALPLERIRTLFSVKGV